MLSVPPPSDVAAKAIFGGILSGFLGDFSPELRSMAGPLVAASVEAYNRCETELTQQCAKRAVAPSCLHAPNAASTRRTCHACSTPAAACLALQRRLSEELLPTPAKSHYAFNLRDLSKQFQGMLMATPASVHDREGLSRLWLHEACRVFGDRLVCDEDVRHFQGVLVSGAGACIGLSCMHAAPDTRMILLRLHAHEPDLNCDTRRSSSRPSMACPA